MQQLMLSRTCKPGNDLVMNLQEFLILWVECHSIHVEAPSKLYQIQLHGSFQQSMKSLLYVGTTNFCHLIDAEFNSKPWSSCYRTVQPTSHQQELFQSSSASCNTMNGLSTAQYCTGWKEKKDISKNPEIPLLKWLSRDLCRTEISTSQNISRFAWHAKWQNRILTQCLCSFTYLISIPFV
jgi:hypothetical protein